MCFVLYFSFTPAMFSIFICSFLFLSFIPTIFSLSINQEPKRPSIQEDLD